MRFDEIKEKLEAVKSFSQYVLSLNMTIATKSSWRNRENRSVMKGRVTFRQ